MFVCKVLLSVILLLQFVVNGQQLENCTEGDFRQQPRGEGNGIFIQYCSGKSWYYLCGGSVGLSPPEAAVVCRQLGYSDQGANSKLAIQCPAQLVKVEIKAFRLNRPCNGTETNLAECGILVFKESEVCLCGALAEIMCQQAVAVTQSPDSPPATATNDLSTTLTITTIDIVSHITTIITVDSVSPTTTSQDDNTTSINNTALGAVIGVLVALVAVVLITVVCVVVVYMCKKSVQQSHQLEGPSTKRNESYTFAQPDVPVYDDASSTQPDLRNHICQFEGPLSTKHEYFTLRRPSDSVYDELTSIQTNYISLDIEAVNNKLTNGYDSIECMTKPKTELANHTPKNESYICDDEGHSLDVADAKEKKITLNDKRNKPKSSVQETPPNPTPVRDDASKMEDDFYDAEEHTYSVVIKSKKKANKKPSENGEGEREEKY